MPIAPAAYTPHGAHRLPLVAALVLTAALLSSFGAHQSLAPATGGTAANVISMDRWEPSMLPATRSVGKSDAESNRAPNHLHPLLVLVALVFGLARRGWTSASPQQVRPLRPGFVEPRGARAPPAHI